MLREALTDAVRTGRLADNVAVRLTLPRHNPDRDLEHGEPTVRRQEVLRVLDELGLTLQVQPR